MPDAPREDQDSPLADDRDAVRSDVVQRYRHGLMQVAFGSQFDESGYATATGMAACMDLVAEGFGPCVVASVDLVAQVLVAYAEQLGIDPGCLAGVLCEAPLSDAVGEPGRMVLLIVEELLLSADPSGSAHRARPHLTCRPWPEGTVVPSLVDVHDGGLLASALAEADEIGDWGGARAGVLTLAVPELLVALAEERSNGDPFTSIELLRPPGGF